MDWVTDRMSAGVELALAPTLQALGDDPRAGLEAIASMRFRAVQLSATQPGLRPRELDGSARRGLRAALRRLELVPAGVDLWIPPEHLSSAAHVDRAVAAVRGAIEFAADLDLSARVPVSLTLPLPEARVNGSDTRGNETGNSLPDAVAEIAAYAQRYGVELADHAAPLAPREGIGESIGVGIDPAAWLARGENPVRIVSQLAARLVSARLVDLLASGMRGPPGAAGADHRLDTLAYRVALSVAGYRRPVVLDARDWRDVTAGLLQTASHWNDLASRAP